MPQKSKVHRRPFWQIVYWFVSAPLCLPLGVLHLALELAWKLNAWVVRHLSAPSIAELRRQLRECPEPNCTQCEAVQYALDVSIRCEFALPEPYVHSACACPSCKRAGIVGSVDEQTLATCECSVCQQIVAQRAFTATPPDEASIDACACAMCARMRAFRPLQAVVLEVCPCPNCVLMRQADQPSRIA